MEWNSRHYYLPSLPLSSEMSKKYNSSESQQELSEGVLKGCHSNTEVSSAKGYMLFGTDAVHTEHTLLADMSSW